MLTGISPAYPSMIESIQLYRGKNIQGCDHLYKETLVFETYDLSVTEYEDEVELWIMGLCSLCKRLKR